MKPPAIVGLCVLVAVTAACITWVSIDPQRTQAWTLLGQAVAAAGTLVALK